MNIYDKIKSNFELLAQALYYSYWQNYKKT